MTGILRLTHVGFSVGLGLFLISGSFAYASVFTELNLLLEPGQSGTTCARTLLKDSKGQGGSGGDQGDLGEKRRSGHLERNAADIVRGIKLILNSGLRYEDIFTVPVEPVAWLSLREKEARLASDQELDGLLKIALKDPKLFAALKESTPGIADMHSLIHVMHQVLAEKPDEFGLVVAPIYNKSPSKFTALLKILSLEGEGDFAIRTYLHELGFSYGFRQERPIFFQSRQEGLKQVGKLDGEYWDIGSGIGMADRLFVDLLPENHYVFFDISPLIVGYLNGVIARYGFNAEAIQADARSLPQPGDRAVSVVRMKNVWGYVRGADKYLIQAAGLIQAGGRLILQDAKMFPRNLLRLLTFTKEPTLTLLQQGWTLTYDMDEKDGRGMYTIVLTKPIEGAARRISNDASLKLWEEMLAKAPSSIVEKLPTQNLGKSGL
jgi:SAM-dependent methyltransferase